MDSRVGPALAQVVLVALSALDNTIGSIAKLLRVCRTTIDKYVSELAGGGGALVAAATPNALPSGEFMIDPLTDSAAVLVLGIRLAWHAGAAPDHPTATGTGTTAGSSCRRAFALSRRWGCRQG